MPLRQRQPPCKLPTRSSTRRKRPDTTPSQVQHRCEEKTRLSYLFTKRKLPLRNLIWNRNVKLSLPGADTYPVPNAHSGADSDVTPFTMSAGSLPSPRHSLTCKQGNRSAMAPVRRYLRITKYSVLECRIYLDSPALAQSWLLHPRHQTLARVIEAIRPLVLPKLREERERERAKKKPSKKSRVKDVIVQGTRWPWACHTRLVRWGSLS